MSSVAKGEEVQMIAEKQEEKPAVAEEKTTANAGPTEKKEEMLEAGTVAAAEGVHREAGAKRPAEDVSALSAEEGSKRMKTEGALEASTAIPPAPAHAVPSQASGMIGTVQVLLDQCFSTGICRPAELDARVMEGLRSLSQTEGISALGEFMKADMSRVRNKSAYLSGVISRIKDDRIGGGGGRGRGAGSGFDQFGGGMNQMGGGYHVPSLAPQFNQFGGLTDHYGGGHLPPPPPQGGYGGGIHGYGQGVQSLSVPNFGILTPTVNATMEQLFMRGTVQRWEIDQKCVDGLRALPETLAIEAIQDFSCRDLLQIRNKSAYFMGCINKRKENMQMSAGGGLPHGSGEAANSPIVREKLEQMFASGMMPRETLDYRAWSEFSKLREADAISALEEFMASDQTRIRNKAAYFMGICKKRTY